MEGRSGLGKTVKWKVKGENREEMKDIIWGREGKYNWEVSRFPPACLVNKDMKLLKAAGHVMHQQFNIQQLYALPTLYLCVLYLSENKQRLVPLTA